MDRRNLRSGKLLLTIEQIKSILKDQEDTPNNEINKRDIYDEEDFNLVGMSTPKNDKLNEKSYDSYDTNSSGSLEDTIIRTKDKDTLGACTSCSKIHDLVSSMEEENKKMKLWIINIFTEFRKEIQESLADIKTNQAQQQKGDQRPAERLQSQPKHLNPDAEKFLRSIEHLKNQKPGEHKGGSHQQAPKVISDQRVSKDTFIPRANGSQDHRKTYDTSSKLEKHRQERPMTPTANQQLPNEVRSSQNIKTYGTIIIHKQVERPGRLRTDELDSERKVSQLRRNNIVISGKLDDSWKEISFVEKLLEKNFNIKPEIRALKRINNEIIITLGSINIKKVYHGPKS